MSSIRFTRKYLLEQISEKFEPGMADREAEMTMRQKVKREHHGATAEMMGRLASDQTRQILSTAPQVQERLREAAGVVLGTTVMAAGVIGGSIFSAGTWLKDTVLQESPNGGGGGKSSDVNREGEKLRVAVTNDDGFVDLSFDREL